MHMCLGKLPEKFENYIFSSFAIANAPIFTMPNFEMGALVLTTK